MSRRRGKPRRKKRPPLRLPVPPPGEPMGTKRGRKGYDRSGKREEIDREIEEGQTAEEEAE